MKKKIVTTCHRLSSILNVIHIIGITNFYEWLYIKQNGVSPNFPQIIRLKNVILPITLMKININALEVAI